MMMNMANTSEWERERREGRTRLRVAALLTSIMNERGWDAGELAQACGAPNTRYMVHLLNGNFNLTFVEVAEMLDRMGMELVMAARKKAEPRPEPLSVKGVGPPVEGDILTWTADGLGKLPSVTDALRDLVSAINADQSQLDMDSSFPSAYARAIAALEREAHNVG